MLKLLWVLCSWLFDCFLGCSLDGRSLVFVVVLLLLRVVRVCLFCGLCICLCCFVMFWLVVYLFVLCVLLFVLLACFVSSCVWFVHGNYDGQ